MPKARLATRISFLPEKMTKPKIISCVTMGIPRMMVVYKLANHLRGLMVEIFISANRHPRTVPMTMAKRAISTVFPRPLRITFQPSLAISTRLITSKNLPMLYQYPPFAIYKICE